MQRLISFFLFAVVTWVFSVPAFCDYEIDWYTIDGGGQTSSGGRYTLTGTIGQPDTGVSGGGDYELRSGFWSGSFGCIVSLTDLAILSEQWLAAGVGFTADFDGNDHVDFADFAEFSYWWYDACPADWPLR